MRAAEQDRPDVKKARALWRREQPAWDAARLVFIDETGLNTKLARLYGRCPHAARCLGVVPHGHWQSSTFLAALRLDQITAPFLVDGPVDAAAFLVYVQQVLLPSLQPGDTLILDNLRTHKVQGVAELLAAWEIKLRYLPPYSPDLNPIEMAFAKLKAHLRRMAARNLQQLVPALARALKTFSAADCQAFFRHAH